MILENVHDFFQKFVISKKCSRKKFRISKNGQNFNLFFTKLIDAHENKRKKRNEKGNIIKRKTQK